MIEAMLAGRYAGLRLHHVRMGFSDEMDEVGRFQIKKLARLIGVIAQTWLVTLRSGAKIMYYPPAGPDRVPFYRDVVILTLIRPLFRHTIFHFHASGISNLYATLPPWLQRLFVLAYQNPDLTIVTNTLGPPDASFLKARRSVTIPNGIPDEAVGFTRGIRGNPPTILFVGLVCHAKGVGVLLDALARLHRDAVDFRARILGRFASSEEERQFRASVSHAGLEEIVRFEGVVSGDPKWTIYRDADIFCFPSHFSSESFPVVLLEAMMFSLPVVATRWKGIPAIVDENESGFLVPVEDASSITDYLRKLICDPALRTRMGARGRSRFLQKFTINVFQKRIQHALLSLAEEDTP